MDMEETFGEMGHQIICPPSATQSFSSASSSSYGPFTPSSGRSTPHRRPATISLETSFYATEPNPFDMTPPSSAVSSYFTGEDFMPAGEMPLTPGKTGAHMLDGTMNPHGCISSYTPAHAMEMYPSFMDAMSGSPFMVPTPHTLTGGQPDLNPASMWCGPLDDGSHMDYYEKQHILMSHSGKDDMIASIYNQPRRRPFLDGPQQKSNALHRAQQQSATLQQMHCSKENRTLVPGSNISVQRIVAGTFKCDAAGCTSRPFKRMEHLKRHKFTCHNPIIENFQCKYCVHKFNRRDNWRQHLKLHTQRRGRSSRTDYFPEAVQEYEDEMRRIKQRRPCKAKLRATALSGEA